MHPNPINPRNCRRCPMKTNRNPASLRIVLAIAAVTFGALGAAAFFRASPMSAVTPAPATSSIREAGLQPETDALAPLLAPHGGDRREDDDIRKAQARVREGRNLTAGIERLGWAFVAKARASHDESFYMMAGRCAAMLQNGATKSPEGLLLRGHVLHSMHRFKDAETIARELIAIRGQPADFGLLADTLMDQGRITEAVEACQTMLDQRPSPEAYARAAHLRWLKGDPAGATELMEMATAAVGADSKSESAAWLITRLGFHRFLEGKTADALRVCEEVLRHRSDYAPALLLKGRALLGNGDAEQAVEALRAAVGRDPLPESRWLLAEALLEVGRAEEAAEVETALHRDGASADARTYALFLATRGASPERAVQLAENELALRGDVFTHDALAWALAAASRFEEAMPHARKALAEGTQDARLFFHAAFIAAKCGHDAEAREWYALAAAMPHQLLPSERARLRNASGAPLSAPATERTAQPDLGY